jgi:hypothetical protein
MPGAFGTVNAVTGFETVKALEPAALFARTAKV